MLGLGYYTLFIIVLVVRLICKCNLNLTLLMVLCCVALAGTTGSEGWDCQHQPSSPSFIPRRGLGMSGSDSGSSYVSTPPSFSYVSLYVVFILILTILLLLTSSITFSPLHLLTRPFCSSRQLGLLRVPCKYLYYRLHQPCL